MIFSDRSERDAIVPVDMHCSNAINVADFPLRSGRNVVALVDAAVFHSPTLNLHPGPRGKDLRADFGFGLVAVSASSHKEIIAQSQRLF